MNKEFFNTPQQQATSLQRAGSFMRTIGGMGMTVSIMAIAGQIVLPEEYKPSTVIGKSIGYIEASDVKAKQEITLAYMREQARIKAEADARAAIEIDVARQQAQNRADALQARTVLTNGLDIACIIGMFIPQDAESTGLRNAGVGLRKTCGAGAKIRDGMTEELAQAGREGSSVQPRGNSSTPR